MANITPPTAFGLAVRIYAYRAGFSSKGNAIGFQGIIVK